MSNNDKSMTVVLEILLDKFGSDKIKGLLTGKFTINDAPPVRVKRYSRDMEDIKNLFCECKDGKHEWCMSPGSVIQALEDAREVMNYSNWAADRFDRAIELIFRHCTENKIPLWHEREADLNEPEGE